MVTTERDHTRQSLALLRRADLVRIGSRLAGEDAVVALLDLVKSPAVVVPASESVLGQSLLVLSRPLPRVGCSLRCDWDITTV